jgi:prophage regulatory protein
MTETPTFHYETRLIRINEVVKLTGLSRTYAYGLAAAGLFPRSVPLVPGGKARAWVYAEVQEWLKQRIVARDQE